MTNDLKTTDHITIDEIIRQAGGFEELKGTLQEFEEINFRIDSQHETLLTSYPLKWAAMGKNDFFNVGDSLESVCKAARSHGLGASEYAVRFLNPNPPVMIL